MTHTIPPHHDRRLLMQRRENVIDLDICVEDARADLHQALDRYRAAVAARDAEAQRLADLIARWAA